MKTMQESLFISVTIPSVTIATGLAIALLVNWCNLS